MNFRALSIPKSLEPENLVRYITVFVTVSMTVTAFQWSMEFATASERPGGDIAMIIGAIMGPLSLLQGAVFNYSLKNGGLKSHVNDN